jgi:hypothetical protein
MKNNRRPRSTESHVEETISTACIIVHTAKNSQILAQLNIDGIQKFVEFLLGQMSDCF